MKTIILAVGLWLALDPSLTADDPAVITDSGSTNTAGFRIDVSQSGEAVYTPKPRRAGQIPEDKSKPMTRQIPSAVLKRFFADLDAAESFSSLPHQGCMKSASFGTTLIIEYRDQRSPDLRCGDHGNAKLKALIQDCGDIIQVFHTD